MAIGYQLKAALQDRGLKLKSVADNTGIPYNTLIQYLNEHMKIPSVKLRCICLTYGIDQKIFADLDSQSNRREPA